MRHLQLAKPTALVKQKLRIKTDVTFWDLLA